MKPLIVMLLGAAAGGALGYSQVLCWNGQCIFLGTWYGGALLGGGLGLMLASSRTIPATTPPDSTRPPDDQ